MLILAGYPTATNYCGFKVLTVDSELRAKLDVATAKIASMEAELAALRAKNARSQVLQSSDVEQ